MRTLSLDILAGDLKIGTCDVAPSDPSMGVASGIFHPGAAYSAMIHARESEAFQRISSDASLRARDSAGANVECAGVDLVDFSQTLGDEGRELHVLGISQYAAYFEGS